MRLDLAPISVTWLYLNKVCYPEESRDICLKPQLSKVPNQSQAAVINDYS